MEDKVYAIIKANAGITDREIQSRLGVDPENELHRPDVWKIRAALVGLQQRGWIRREDWRGHRFYSAGRN